MAQIYHHQVVHIDDALADIRAIDEEDHHVAITFQGVEDDDVTEVLLTKSEVQLAYDLLFNK